MSYCQCRLKLVFASIFREFHFEHVALLLDRSDLFSLTVGKNLEYGLKEEGVLKFVRELTGNELLHGEKVNKSESEKQMKELKAILRDASMYSRVIILSVRGQLVRQFMLAAYELGMTKGNCCIFRDLQSHFPFSLLN
jgi:atrial natriuretic peptide receptor A